MLLSILDSGLHLGVLLCYFPRLQMIDGGCGGAALTPRLFGGRAILLVFEPLHHNIWQVPENTLDDMPLSVSKEIA